MVTSPPATGRAPTLAARGRHYLELPWFRTLWRYGAVSVLTTFLSLGLLYLFWRVLKVDRLDVDGWRISSAGTANIYATAISTIPSYYLNRRWAWGKTGKSHLWREVVPFWVIAAASLVLSTVVVGWASREAQQLSSRHEVQTVLGEAGNLVTYGVIWVAKFFLFNRVLFRDRPVAEAEVAPTGPAGGLPAYGGKGVEPTGSLNGHGAIAEAPIAEAR